jgi:hypothetical protein
MPYNPPMHMPSFPDIPSTPRDFQRIGWHGMAFCVPVAWNVSLYLGNRNRGTLIFSDLRGTVLEVRWNTPRALGILRGSVTRATQRLVARIRRQHAIEKLDKAYFAPPLALALWDDGARIYELHWPGKARHVEQIVRDFLECQKQMMGSDSWLWEIYGVRSWIARDARLKSASLGAGRSELKFTEKNGRITTGAYSMADRLLGNKSLQEWARGNLLALTGLAQPQTSRGLWMEERPRLVYRVQPPSGGLRHGTCHELSLERDDTLNCIRWTHQYKRDKK